MCEEIFKNNKKEIEEFQDCESVGRPISVVDEINRGIHLKNQHKLLIDQNETIDKIKPLYERHKKICKKKPPKRGEVVWKIIYPKPDKYKPCKHFGVPIKDRDIFSRTNYIQFLSQPRPKIKPKYPKFVQRTIYPCSMRIDELAQPPKSSILSTWTKYIHLLSPYQIENFRNMLNRVTYTTTNQAIEYFKQQKKDEKRRKRCRQKKINKLMQKIIKKKLGDVKNILNTIYDKMKNFIMNSEEYELSDEMLKMSDTLLIIICQFIGSKLPNRKSKKVCHKFLVNLADKLTVWISNFLTTSGYIQECEAMINDYDDVICEDDAKEIRFEDMSCIDVTVSEDNIQYPIDDYIKYIQEEEESYIHFEDGEEASEEGDEEELEIPKEDEIETLVEKERKESEIEDVQQVVDLEEENP